MNRKIQKQEKIPDRKLRRALATHRVMLVVFHLVCMNKVRGIFFLLVNRKESW